MLVELGTAGCYLLIAEFVDCWCCFWFWLCIVDLLSWSIEVVICFCLRLVLLNPVAVRFTQLLSGQHEFPRISFFRIRMGRGSMLTHPQYVWHEYTFPCSPDDQLLTRGERTRILPYKNGISSSFCLTCVVLWSVIHCTGLLPERWVGWVELMFEWAGDFRKNPVAT